MTSQDKNLAWLAYLAVFIGTIGHASSEFVAVLSGINGPEVSVWRFMIGGFGLLVACFLMPSSRDLKSVIVQDWRRIVPLAICGMTLAQFVFHWALDYATVVQVATMVTTMPILVVLINWVVHRIPITAPKLVSGAGAVIGIAFLLTDGYLAKLGGSSESFVGVMMALVSALAGASYTVMIKPVIVKWGAMRVTTLVFVIGFFALWPLVAIVFDVQVNPATLFERDAQAWGSILTLGFWNTTIAMVIFFWGLSTAPDQARANYIFFLKPVIAAFLGLYILKQPVTTPQMLAIVVITVCVLVEVFWEQLQAIFRNRSAG